MWRHFMAMDLKEATEEKREEEKSETEWKWRTQEKEGMKTIRRKIVRLREWEGTKENKDGGEKRRQRKWKQKMFLIADTGDKVNENRLKDKVKHEEVQVVIKRRRNRRRKKRRWKKKEYEK